MEFSKTFLDLLLEDKLQLDEGKELHEFEVITLPLGGFTDRLIKAGNELVEQAFK